MTGGVRPRKLSSASLYSSGLSDEAATRIRTWSASGRGTRTRACPRMKSRVEIQRLWQCIEVLPERLCDWKNHRLTGFSGREPDFTLRQINVVPP